MDRISMLFLLLYFPVWLDAVTSGVSRYTQISDRCVSERGFSLFNPSCAELKTSCHVTWLETQKQTLLSKQAHLLAGKGAEGHWLVTMRRRWCCTAPISGLGCQLPEQTGVAAALFNVQQRGSGGLVLTVWDLKGVYSFSVSVTCLGVFSGKKQGLMQASDHKYSFLLVITYSVLVIKKNKKQGHPRS